MNNLINHLGNCLIKVDERKGNIKLLAETLVGWWMLHKLPMQRIQKRSQRTGMMVNLPKYEPWEIAAIHDTTNHVKKTVSDLSDEDRRKLRYFIHIKSGHPKTTILYNQFGLV